jgi:hypothetical protein
MQGHALHTIQGLFRDTQGDAALLRAVSGKIGYYPSAKVVEPGLERRPVVRQQVDALKVLMHTFKGTDDGDVELRHSALDKLGKMGSAADIKDIMPLVRRPPHSADLTNGVNAINAIAAREGSPFARGHGHLSGEVKALLGKAQVLTDSERRKVIEDVLAHGEIESVVKDNSGTANEVYFVTFKDKLPGPLGTIRGVFKPERPFAEQQKPFFTREVAGYYFDRDFAKTDIIPITVEAVLAPNQIRGDVKPSGIGSMQYMIPNGKSLGRVGEIRPEYKAFLEAPDGQRQLREIRTHLFVRNDPEKLRTTWAGQDNWGNILAEPIPGKPDSYKLWLIDNGTAMGALTRPTEYDPYGRWVNPDMLPGPTNTSRNLKTANRAAMESKLAPLIGDWDAHDIANRVERTIQTQ